MFKIGGWKVIFMHQRDFAEEILRRAGTQDSNKVITPAIPGRKYTKDSGPKTDDERKALEETGRTKAYYHSIVMACQYLVNSTRDDLRYIQGKLAKFCSNPGAEHFDALKHQLRYLSGTRDYGLTFSHSDDDPPH